jgi:hypothetical protein
LDSFFIKRLSGWHVHHAYLMPIVSKSIVPEPVHSSLGFPGFLAMVYLSAMDGALELITAGGASAGAGGAAAATDGFFHAVIRYEDLCEHRLQIVNKMFAACGCPPIAAADAGKIFDEDAHKATTGGIASERRAKGAKGRW